MGIRDIHLSRNTMLALVTVIGIAVIAVLVYLLVLTNGGNSAKKSDTKTRAEPSGNPTLSQPSPGVHVNNTDPAILRPSPDQADIVNRARNFTDAWLHLERSQDAWLNGMRQYCSRNFMQTLAGVQPDDINSVRRTGDPVVTSAGNGYANVNVPLDNGVLTLHFNYDNGTFLIQTYDFELKS
ncbi:MAG: hypothetical protein ACRDQZ_10700 [Mycobacteriales bacterium]